jgi:hypothetical protein
VGIDSQELADRVVGYRVSLAGFKGSLHADGVWSADRLGALVDELEEIVLRRGDLLLYLRLVSPESEEPKLDSPSAVLTLVSGKISAARQRLESSRDPATGAARREEFARLSDLSRRVAAIAARLQQQ